MKDFKSALNEIPLTHAQIAELLGLSQPSISKSSNPTLSRITDIASATGYKFSVDSWGHMHFRAMPRPEDCTPEQDAILQAYERVSDAIQSLEVLRDYGDGIGEDSEKILVKLNELWDEIRRHPDFWEPEI